MMMQEIINPWESPSRQLELADDLNFKIVEQLNDATILDIDCVTPSLCQ